MDIRQLVTKATAWLIRSARHSDGGWGVTRRDATSRTTTTCEALIAISRARLCLGLADTRIEQSIEEGSKLLCDAIDRFAADPDRSSSEEMKLQMAYHFAWATLALESTGGEYNAAVALCREALMARAQGTHADHWGHNSTYETATCALALSGGAPDQRLFAGAVSHSLLNLRLPNGGWAQTLEGTRRDAAATCYVIRLLAAIDLLPPQLRDDERHELLRDVPGASVDLEIVSPDFKFSHYLPALLVSALVHTGAELWRPSIWPALENLVSRITIDGDYCYSRDSEGEESVFATSHNVVALCDACMSFDSWSGLANVVQYVADLESTVARAAEDHEAEPPDAEEARAPGGSRWLFGGRLGSFVLVGSMPVVVLASLVIIGIGLLALLQDDDIGGLPNWSGLVASVGLVVILWAPIWNAIIRDDERRDAIRSKHKILWRLPGFLFLAAALISAIAGIVYLASVI